MSWKKWFPWRYLLKKIARAEGFVDPIQLMSKLQRFAQPSEVAAPVELLRLSTVLQARGLMNAQAIQHNLDWIWPYWVVRQFDPTESSFIPRAFSITHINLTHRNWTAVGLPDAKELPIVDPRGLVTPVYDGWSLDAWVLDPDNEHNHLFPSKLASVKQEMLLDENLRINTSSSVGEKKLTSSVQVLDEDGEICLISYRAKAKAGSKLVISLRPFNPEGVSSVDSIRSLENAHGWEVNKEDRIFFAEKPAEMCFSTYREGDVFFKIRDQIRTDDKKMLYECEAGMASAAAVFVLRDSEELNVRVKVPLSKKKNRSVSFSEQSQTDKLSGWKQLMQGKTELSVPDKKIQTLYDQAILSMMLHSPRDTTYPGPYTYKHFWFRDAAFIVNALLACGMTKKAKAILDSFPARQNLDGYFCSQQGEWDSNGQVLWIMNRYRKVSGDAVSDHWKRAVIKGAEWIIRKRLKEGGKPHSGLFPPGFSAEHLGPNDYYYWDNFWGAGGLRAASEFLNACGEEKKASFYLEISQSFMKSINASLSQAALRLGKKVMPSSPYRRFDTGVIGSLAAGYPLRLWPDNDDRLVETADYLYNNHFVRGGFFHDMSHSGINPYLTLHIAQVFLRNGDVRFLEILRSIRDLASPTGQWPEAIHPQTGGGCMGDGQHIWASAEWVRMIRNCFVREEGEKLVLCSGLDPSWLNYRQEITFGPAPTEFGVVDLKILSQNRDVTVSWKIRRHHESVDLVIAIPGADCVIPGKEATEASVSIKEFV